MYLKLQMKFTFLSRLIYGKQFIYSNYSTFHWTTNRGISTNDILQQSCINECILLLYKICVHHKQTLCFSYHCLNHVISLVPHFVHAIKHIYNILFLDTLYFIVNCYESPSTPNTSTIKCTLPFTVTCALYTCIYIPTVYQHWFGSIEPVVIVNYPLEIQQGSSMFRHTMVRPGSEMKLVYFTDLIIIIT